MSIAITAPTPAFPTIDDVMLCVLKKDNQTLKELVANSLNNVFDSILPRNSKILKEDAQAKQFVMTTPLFAAVRTGNVEAAKILLDNGANIKKIISAPNGLLSSPYELCILSENKDFDEIIKNYAIKRGIVSATNVVRSGKSHALQYGSKNK